MPDTTAENDPTLRRDDAIDIDTFSFADPHTIHFEVTADRPPARRRPMGWVLTVLLSAMVGAATAAGVVFALDEDAPPATTVVASPSPTTPTTPTTVVAAGDAFSAADVAARVLPSIVTVEVATTTGTEFVADATGSGVVWDDDGLIVTNHHVVEDAVAVRVAFLGGRTYQATVVGGDALTDIAVLRIDAAGLTPITVGSADAMQIGDVAVAVGSPLGLEGGPSVTVGVLSAFDRTVRTTVDSELFGMLQTDAPITRGSSGGALVDARGRLIGITSAIGVSDVGAEGLGFAIPVEMVERIIEDLIADGVASHAFLGITGATHYEPQEDGAIAPAGVLVTSVITGTAAEAAGLLTGDIVHTFDGEPVVTMEGLVVRLRFLRVGDTVRLGISRDGGPEELDVVLMQRPEDV